MTSADVKLTKAQSALLNCLTEHAEIAISWAGPLETFVHFTPHWMSPWPWPRYPTFKALLKRGLLVEVGQRIRRGVVAGARYYRPKDSRVWTERDAWCDRILEAE